MVTPLFMAGIAQAIANNGVRMKPYVVDHIENFAEKTIETKVPETYAQYLQVKKAKN